MANNKIIDTAVTVAKVVGATIVTAAVAEAGFHGGMMLGNDIELIVNMTTAKKNADVIVMKRRWPFAKPRPYNQTKKCWVE